MASDPHAYPDLEQVMLQVRHDMADALRVARRRHPDLGFCVFVMNLGPGGGLAYGATVQREDMVRALIEFVRSQMAVGNFTEYQRSLAATLYTATRRPEDGEVVDASG